MPQHVNRYPHDDCLPSMSSNPEKSPGVGVERDGVQPIVYRATDKKRGVTGTHDSYLPYCRRCKFV